MDEHFLEYIVTALVTNPDDVRVVETRDDMGVLLSVDVNVNDMGLVIGKMGATAKALRTLVRVYGMKHGARVSLRINEPVGGKKYVEA